MSRLNFALLLRGVESQEGSRRARDRMQTENFYFKASCPANMRSIRRLAGKGSISASLRSVKLQTAVLTALK